VSAKECHEGVLTRGIDQGDEVFEVGDLEGGLRKQEPRMPLKVGAAFEKAGVKAGRS